MARPQLEPVTADTLPEFAQFLHDHLDASRSPAQWVQSFAGNGWPGDAPNHGFVVRDEGRIVGAIGALYAERSIDGQPARTCNITSWCVLDSHRQQSMRLAMAVVSQKGWHFSDFSPTKVVAGTLQFLKFKPLDDRQVVTLNLPWPALPGGWRIVTAPQEIEQALGGAAKTDWQHHRQYPWLNHVLIGRPGAWCHVIYKRRVFKGLPTAAILHASDDALLRAGWRRLAGHLLARGLPCCQVEYRLLQGTPWPAAIRSGFNPKLFLSDSLRPEQVDYLYSESMALDL